MVLLTDVFVLPKQSYKAVGFINRDTGQSDSNKPPALLSEVTYVILQIRPTKGGFIKRRELLTVKQKSNHLCTYSKTL